MCRLHPLVKVACMNVVGEKYNTRYTEKLGGCNLIAKRLAEKSIHSFIVSRLTFARLAVLSLSRKWALK